MALAHSSPVDDGVPGGVGGSADDCVKHLLTDSQTSSAAGGSRSTPGKLERTREGRTRCWFHVLDDDLTDANENQAGRPGGVNTSVNEGAGARYVLVTSKEKLINGKEGEGVKSRPAIPPTGDSQVCWRCDSPS